MPPISGGAGSSSVGGAGIVAAGLGGSAGTAGTAGAGGSGGTPSDTGNGGSAGALSVDPDGPPLPRALPGATTMLSDPFRDRLYVAIGRTALEYPNSIVTFDPSASVIVADTPVGAHPDSLAVSDDGTRLWVGLHDTSSVLELDISGDAPVPTRE